MCFFIVLIPFFVIIINKLVDYLGDILNFKLPLLNPYLLEKLHFFRSNDLISLAAFNVII